MGAIALSIANKFVDAEQPKGWGEVANAVGRSIWDIFRPSEWVPFIIEHPILAGIILLSVGLHLVSIGAFIHIGQIRQDSEKAKEQLQTFKALADSVGIGAQWQTCIGTKDTAPWPDVISEINRYGNNTVFVFGANGVDTFGTQKSPLYDALANFDSLLNVMMLNPISEALNNRAVCVATDAGQYASNVEVSAQRLADLTRKNKNISLRYYDTEPGFKMIITDRTAWVQYYTPSGPDINTTPIYRFDNTDNRYGLYRFFNYEFRRLWRQAEDHEVDLTTFRPKVGKRRPHVQL